MTVVGVIQGAHNRGSVGAAADLGQRPQFFDLCGGDDFERYTDCVGRSAVLLVLIHALFAGCEAQVASDVKAHILAGFLGQALVEVDRVLVELTYRVAHVEEWQESGGVPSGACRQLGSLEQRDIGPTFLRQMVERADANNATADHYDPKMRFHI